MARLHLGLQDIIQMARISPEKERSISDGCFEIGQTLILAEKAALPLMGEIRGIQEKLLRDGVRTQNERCVETPGVLHLDDARVFLKYAKQALQTLAKALGVILDREFHGPHFDRVRDHAIKTLGAEHPLSQLLVEDHFWIKEIIDLRNEDEHPKSGKPFVNGFSISKFPDGQWHVAVPSFHDGISILNRLEVYSHNLLTFSEETIALSLQTFFPKGVAVFEIPEKDRQAECPVRFRTGLKEGLPKPPIAEDGGPTRNDPPENRSQ